MKCVYALVIRVGSMLTLLPYPKQDSITGLLLAGIGHVNDHQKKNFLIVDSSACIIYFIKRCLVLNAFYLTETQVSTIEAAFQEFTERKDIAILLINQHVSNPIVGTRNWVSNIATQMYR